MNFGQFLLTGVPGKQLDSETAARFKRIQPGGFILFGRNIEDQKPEDLRKLIDDLRDLCDIEPFITIDQEGGRVSRLRMLEGGQEPPNAQQLREKGDLKLIKDHGQLTGEILRLFGFNLDLCPVLDISYQNDETNSLRGRTWGMTAKETIDNASVFNKAMRDQGILSSGKHFPGYSEAEVDPHHALPVINKTAEEMAEHELLPFQALMPNLDSMMIGHAWYPCYDAERERWPASLSDKVIQQLLRNQLGFDGLVMTDDLDMGAILNEVSFEDTIRLAIEAGNDLAMICHRLDMVEEAKGYIEKLPHPILDDALRRIEVAKKKMASPKKWSMSEFERINAKIWDLRVATIGEALAKIPSTEDGARSPVELY
ncbi:MAG: beta-N-acetylhexosaminidase [Verrucomicrobiales bacterium]|jgi:beta-N-acetylhexosaminidase